MIEVKQVTKTYGKKKNIFTALDDVNFSVPSNTSVAIVGKSGSGKSTLMHIMSGLDRPQHGEIIIGDRDILKLKARQTDSFRAKQMGFVFQSFFVEANESCYENVSLSLEMSRTPQMERRKRIEAALADVDLTDKIKSKAGDLSGGQKQRLAIARAIVNQPKLLFADEPTGNLDTATSQVVEDLLFKYQTDNKATLIIVTHDEELAARCDMQIIISDGKISEIHEAAKKESK
ncbi:MAG: ABC transporter ATP-binding protein [bacterium]|nr:ABC transporter ATP-binding protein [bacterium]MDN5835112.1 ABC transporter ATP-binding protein [bacterium]